MESSIIFQKIESVHPTLEIIVKSLITSTLIYLRGALSKVLRIGITTGRLKLLTSIKLRRSLLHWGNNYMDTWFIQVGSNDGSQQDLISDYIKGQWNGILIEPIPFYFNKLKERYQEKDNLFLENIAIASLEENRDMYYVAPQFINKSNLPTWVNGLGSFSVEHLHKHGIPNAAILKEPVKCCPLTSLVKRYDIQNIGLLAIDAEGYDVEVLKSLDFRVIKPEKIIYESKHLVESVKNESILYLEKNGYDVRVFMDEFNNESIQAVLVGEQGKCFATVSSKEYLVGTRALLNSLVTNNRITEDFVIISDDITNEDVESLKAIYPNVKLHSVDKRCYGFIQDYIDTQNQWVKYIHDKFINMYFKFEVFGLDEYKKIVFLDSDTLVIGDISFLLNLNCDMGAARDGERNEIFNSGVLVIGEKYIGKEVKKKFLEQACEIIKKGGLKDIGDTIADQAILNVILKGKFYEFPNTYNFFRTLYVQCGSMMADVRLVHYVRQKPWEGDQSRYMSFVEQLWHKYAI